FDVQPSFAAVCAHVASLFPVVWRQTPAVWETRPSQASSPALTSQWADPGLARVVLRERVVPVAHNSNGGQVQPAEQISYADARCAVQADPPGAGEATDF